MIMMWQALERSIKSQMFRFYIHTYIYIYIYKEREREREREIIIIIIIIIIIRDLKNSIKDEDCCNKENPKRR